MSARTSEALGFGKASVKQWRHTQLKKETKRIPQHPMIFPPTPDAYHQRVCYLYHPLHGDGPKLFLCRKKRSYSTEVSCASFVCLTPFLVSVTAPQCVGKFEDKRLCSLRIFTLLSASLNGGVVQHFLASLSFLYSFIIISLLFKLM